MTKRFMHIAAATPLLLTLAAALPAVAQDQGSPWSGWYVGLNAGANWSDSDINSRVTQGNGAVVIPPADINLINQSSGGGSNKTGFTGGIEGGYNYLIGNWLLGIETDFVALDVNERNTRNFRSTISPAAYSLNQRAKTSWMWSLRPRLGYVYGPWLFYGTGGIATADIKSEFDFSDNRVPQNVIIDHKSKDKTGWIAGLGAGYALSPNWSVKGEWLYADFGSISTTTVSPNGFAGFTSEAKVRSNIVRAGVDYRF
jgi:outer membrane immunogenic protein